MLKRTIAPRGARADATPPPSLSLGQTRRRLEFQFSFLGKLRILCTAATIMIAVNAIFFSAGARADNVYNFNTDPVITGVAFGKAPFFQPTTNVLVTEIQVYHYNNGLGVSGPINISILGTNGRPIPGGILTASPQGGPVPQTNWVVYPVNLYLPPGSYVIDDSDHLTWSQNAASANIGFVFLEFTPVSIIPLCMNPLGPPCVSTPPSPVTPVLVAPGPAPCDFTTSAAVQLDRPPTGNCNGPAGTMLTLRVVRAIPAPITSVFFIGGSIGRSKGFPHKVPGPLVGPVPGSIILTTGNGIAPGSVYTVAAPAGLCVLGSGDWYWDIFPNFMTPAAVGDVDVFNITGCP